MPASADGQIADAPVAWDCEVDLLIAGAGPAGMTAALVASIEGLSVMLCEKSSQVGGTAATSAGTLWIPGNRQGGGAADEAAGDYLDALVGNRAGGDIRKAYLERGPRVIDYMVESGEIAFLPCGVHPDYRSELPGAAVEGRAIVPAPFDGRLLGRDFARVRPPIGEFMVFGGMMVGKQDIPNLLNRFRSLDNFSYSAKLFARYLRDRLRHARGTRLVMGNALVAQLFYRLRRRAVDIRFDAPLVDLITGKGVVEGAVLSVEGRHMRVRARRGVILATGGIAYNQALREATMPTPSPFSMACETDTGDGIEAGMRVGAALGGKDHITSAFWTPVSVTPAAQGRKGLFPHLAMDRAKPGLIAVNSSGRRFVDEGASYHDFVLAMYESHVTVSTIPAFLVCDATFIRKYGLGLIYPGTTSLKPWIKDGYITVGRTIVELAGRIGVDEAGLIDSVARNNGYASTGKDLDFAKGETNLSRFNGDPAHKPNPGLGPISEPPFVAMKVWPAEIAFSAGLVTDANARVLNAEGRAIDGLYACGNDMASVMSGSYPGPGTTLGPAVVFGYSAVMHALSKAGTTESI